MTTRRSIAGRLALLVALSLLASASATAVDAGAAPALARPPLAVPERPSSSPTLLGLPPSGVPVAPPSRAGSADASGLSKIKHIVIIVQENRSFDEYFGTYPGADGIPMKKNGVPKACVPAPNGGPCVRPYHDVGSVDSGGPHHQKDASYDINGGKMDGFLQRAVDNPRGYDCPTTNDARCMPGTTLPDVMGYKTAQDIPNYWTYAKQFVLQDHMFEPVRSWSLPAHLFLVSGWSAICQDPKDPMSCTTATAEPRRSGIRRAWRALRLDRHHLPAPQGRCLVALLRRQRHAGRLW